MNCDHCGKPGKLGAEIEPFLLETTKRTEVLNDAGDVVATVLDKPTHAWLCNESTGRACLKVFMADWRKGKGWS